MTPCFIVIIFIQRMMSGLGKEIKLGLLLDDPSTHSFILENKQGLRGKVPEVSRQEAQHSQQSLNGCQSKIVFNFDHKCYTPAFIQLIQQDSVRDNDQNYRNNFQNTIQSQTRRKHQILAPKPSSNYCEICKQKFDDYDKHRIHPIHTTNLKASKGQKFIADLIVSFNRPVRRSSTVAEGSEGQDLKKKRKIQTCGGQRRANVMSRQCKLSSQDTQFQQNYQLF